MKKRDRRAYNRAWREKHRGYWKAWREKNRDHIREVRRAWRAANHEKERATDRARYASNREREREKARAWRVAHPEKARAATRAWRAANPEMVRASDRDWRAAHPGPVAHWKAARRARKTGNGGSHTLREWREKLALFANCCAYCGEAKPLTRDHKVPLARGGTDNIMNILPACQGCNSRKGKRTSAEFLALLAERRAA